MAYRYQLLTFTTSRLIARLGRGAEKESILESADAVTGELAAISEVLDTQTVRLIFGSFKPNNSLPEIVLPDANRRDPEVFVKSALTTKPSVLVVDIAHLPSDGPGTDDALLHCLKIADKEDVEQKPYAERLQILHGRPIGYTVYAIHDAPSFFIAYRRETLFSEIVREWMLLEQEAGDDENAHEEEIDDAGATPELSELQTLELGRELAAVSGFSLANSRTKREHFAMTYFSSDGSRNIPEESMEAIAYKAGVIFDMEVFPARVRDLRSSGMTDSQIAKELGCSGAKVAKVPKL